MHEREAAEHEQAPAPPGPAEGPTARMPVLELQRAIGNRGVARLAAGGAVLARQPAPTKVEKPEPIYGWLSDEPLENWEQLAAYYRFGAAMVADDLQHTKVGKTLQQDAEDWVDEIRSWADYYASKKTAKITDEDLRRTHELFATGLKLRKDIQWIGDEPARQAYRRAQERAEQLAREAERLAPKMADSARAAFHAGDESLLASLADITGNITDIGLGIHELARKISEQVATATGTELPAVGKYTEFLDKANKGLAAINLALSITGEKGKTELDEGLRLVGMAAGGFSSLGTLVGLPAHMGLYANLYLVPLTKACIAGVQRLAGFIHEENKSWVEFIGEPANYNVEPGGKPMWLFMNALMKAGDDASVPTPPDAVAEYFVEHRDAFNAGVGGYDKMPISGSLWWKSLDKQAFKRWAYYRRKKLWAMLYGSMKQAR